MAVAPVRRLVHGEEQVGGVLDILHREGLVNRLGVLVLPPLDVPEEVLVVVAACDRLLEDGGIGGDAAQAVFLDQALEVAAFDQVAPYVIEPDRLPVLRDRLKGIHRFRPLPRPAENLARRRHDALGGEAELHLQLFQGRRGPEGPHADAPAVHADVALPAEGGGLHAVRI